MKFIKQNWGFFIAAIVFVAVLFAYYCNILDEKMTLGFLGIAATLYFGILRYKIESDKMFKELFTEFNKRYNDEFDDLFNGFRNNDKEIVESDNTKIIIAYLNLCSEEYLWYRRNRIPRKVWKAWKSGIMDNLKIEEVKKVSIDEMTSSAETKESYYGLFEELDIKINDK